MYENHTGSPVSDRWARGVGTFWRRPGCVLGALASTLLAFAAYAQERQNSNTRCNATAEDSCQWGNFDGRNFDGKDLSDSDFEAIHMRGATLRGATLERITLQVADVSGSDFSSSNLASATFFAANAEKASFAKADLRGVNFTRAQLAGASLRGAKADSTTLFIGARLGGAVWFDGRLCANNSIGKCD